LYLAIVLGGTLVLFLILYAFTKYKFDRFRVIYEATHCQHIGHWNEPELSDTSSLMDNSSQYGAENNNGSNH